MPTLYLNNSGSRWQDTDENAMKFVLVLPTGARYVKKAVCYEALGNFAATIYRYAGKQYKGLAKAHDGSETRDPDATGMNALPHIWHEKSAGYENE